MTDILLLAVAIITGFIVAFAIGSNDESMAPAVGSGVFSLRIALGLGAGFAVFGALTLGRGVSEKVGKDLVNVELTLAMVLAIISAMAIWLILVSVGAGIPISTTQCIVGSVMGVSLLEVFLNPDLGINLIDTIHYPTLFEILLGWLISPVIGFIFAALFYAAIMRIRGHGKVNSLMAYERQERIAGYLLAVFLLVTVISRGGNDVANAVAPLLRISEFRYDDFITLSIRIEGFSDIIIPGFAIPLLLGGIGMATGLIIVGKKVITNLGSEVVTLTPFSALAGSMSVSIVLFFGTAMGLPLSGSHILVAALIAVGWAGKSPVKMDGVKKIGISWIITVPISALLGMIIYIPMKILIPV
ncbi:MAG: anion permease [Candidatus Odinarchaeota archaeon]